MQRRTRWMILVALATLTVAGFVVYRVVSTSDRVQVVIRNLPEDTIFACLIVDSGQSVQCLDWLPWPNYRPLHPATAIISHPNRRQDIGIAYDVFAGWRDGVRYGLVMRDKTFQWRVIWYDARDVPVAGRRPVFGRGSVDFDASQGTAIPFTDEDVEATGLREGGIWL